MIHVLSPHRDDAVFSLFFTLSELGRRGAQLSVSNFFTESAYAPYAGTHDRAAVTEIRKREDRAALRRISACIRIRDCGLVDAPLRLSIAAARVCFTGPNETDMDLVARHLPATSVKLTFLPLGLGWHVDHLTVKCAALRVLRHGRLAFYEDLPYAMWSDDQLPCALAEAEEALQTCLKPLIVRTDRSLFEKRSACARYRSQIQPADAHAMAAWSRRYGCGERIWLPRGSASLF